MGLITHKRGKQWQHHLRSQLSQGQVMATTKSLSETTPSKRKPRKATRATRSSKAKTRDVLKGPKKTKAWLRRLWGKMVRRRDRWTCQECGAKPGARYVQAHHIIPVAEDPDLIFQLDNGITLCLPCHAAKHPKTAHLILRRLTMGTKKKPIKKASGPKAGTKMPMKEKC